MRHTAIPALEDQFRLTGNNGEYTLQPIAVPVPGEELHLNGFLCTPKTRSGYYFDAAHPKQRIVIHYTAGNLKSDIGTLTKQAFHVSVPFVIARDGTVYQLFSSRFWSGHIGKGVGNTGNAQDKCTIGIELSNYGWLTERGGDLETCYSRQRRSDGTTGPADVYCAVTENTAYQQLQTPFRRQSFYATYTEAQYQSLIILLRYLTAKYAIPRQFLPEALRYETTNEVAAFRGIVSHVNYRSDGKWDIGPAFDWEKLIAGVQAVQFQPIIFRGAVIQTGKEALTSEEELEPLLPESKDASLQDAPYEEIEKGGDAPEEGMGFLKSSAVRAKRKVYALLVGLNEYNERIALNGQVVFPQLRGCVPDCQKMKTYLEADPFFDADVKLITNRDATKGAIARLFRAHLGRAQQGDTALFYFSGHGTQEWADTTVWKGETDGKLECLVCYYDEAADDMLLADKELRYLLHEVSKKGAHVVAISDCCHAADNTRNAAIVREYSAVVEKRIAFTFPKRAWDKFLFANEITYNAIKQKGEETLLPEGAHVQLSACESDESALEIDGAGVFTKTLLQVLKAAGSDVSYQSLGGRLRHYLKNVYEQKPRMYAAGDTDALNTNFLARPYTGTTHAVGELVYNDAQGWKLTLGAIHGLTAETKTVRITDPETAQSYEGTIGEIEIDSCFVTPHGDLKKLSVYNGSVEGLLAHRLAVCVQSGDTPLRFVKPLLDILVAETQNYIVAEEEETRADYVVRIEGEAAFITRPSDLFQPLVAPQSLETPNGATALAAQLIHLSKWEFLKHLQNRNSNVLPSDVLQLELTVDDQPCLLDESDAVTINYKKKNGAWENTMRVTLANTTAKNLYCSVLYLTPDFGSDAGLLHPSVYLLEPGNSVTLRFGGQAVPLKLSDVALFYNRQEEVAYLKCISSTEPFDVAALLLEGLPSPPLPGKQGQQPSNGIGRTRGTRKRSLAGWTTCTITLRLRNPFYNTLPERDKKAMVADSRTAPFAKNLYPDLYRSMLLDKKFGAPVAPPKQPTRDGNGPITNGANLKRGHIFLETEPPSEDTISAGAEPPENPFDFGDVFSISGRGTAVAKPQAPSVATASREGQLEYDIPGQMQTGKPHRCTVHLAGNEVTAAALKISSASVHTSIRVADEMSVRLLDRTGGTAFAIAPLSTERQAIDAGEITKWQFTVTPKQSGYYPLLLQITMHGNGKSKDLDILEKEVLITASEDGNEAAKGITRILFIAANPLNRQALRTGAEGERIKEEIKLSKGRDRFLFTTNMAVTARSLSRAILQEDPAIVHFSGHGDEEGLCLETDAGLSKAVSAAALGALFKNFATTIRCVILNACYSKAQAEAIAKYIPAVIGMTQEVKDEVALAFSVGFYQALADGSDIEGAFNIGLAAMALEGDSTLR